MYEAIITPIVNIRSHPNADRIKLGTAAGCQVIVGLDQQEDELGLFFPEGGRLSEEFLKNNNLYRHADKNIDPDAKGGFFEDNGRVRIQKFRGQYSEGFWCPVNLLIYTDGDLSSLEKGQTFQDLFGQKICTKYYTPAMTRAQNRAIRDASTKQKQRLKSRFNTFYEMFDVKQLRFNIQNIPEGAILWISEKCHGTSGRTGNIINNRELWGAGFYNYFNNLARRAKKRKKLRKLLYNIGDTGETMLSGLGKTYYKITRTPTVKYGYVSGTRRVILDPDTGVEKGFYSGKSFRIDIHKKFIKTGIPQGYVIYYELVGFDEQGGLIMPMHSVTNSELKKHYGDKMIYKYGCNQEASHLAYKLLVYRVTHITPDGHTIELPWYQIVSFCQRLGLETVPMIKGPIVYDGNTEKLWKKAFELSEGPSLLDGSHIREGICIRIEHPDMDTILKFKSVHFAEMEGILANDPDFIDPEEIS